VAARAFTVIELMLALALSAAVIMAAMSLYQVLQSSDRNSQARFEQAADMAVTQITLRKIFNTLAAAQAVPENRLPDPGEPNLDDEGGEDNGGNDEATGAEDATESDNQQIAAVPAAGYGSMFDLWWEEYETASGRPVTLPIMEIVVTEPPVALRTAQDAIDEGQLKTIDDDLAEEALRRTDRLAESVRGRLEVVGAEDGWRLYWRPIVPPARPFLLLRGIASVTPERAYETGLAIGDPDILWEVLPRSDELVEWDTSWSGTLRTEFPLAVRLIVMDERGRLIDWLFETHVKAPE
jgi:hypothetical protein